MFKTRGRFLRMRGWLVAALAPTILLAVQPVLAAGRPVNPPPGSATVARFTSEVAAHVPLVDLLALVPDTEANRSWFSYGDVEGWHGATVVPRLSSLDDLDTFSEEENSAWLYDMPRQTAPPAALGISYLMLDDMRPAYGFSFLDAAQMIEAGRPPETLTVVSLNVPSAQVANALAESGYARTELAGATLFSSGDDYAIDLASPTNVGRLGTLNRVAIVESDVPGTQLLIARATAPITQAVAASAGEIRSLADDRIYSTLADAVEGGLILTGTLVGLIVLDGVQQVEVNAAFTSPDADVLARYAADPLPPYRLRAFATTRDGVDTFLTVLIAMGTTGDPQESAAILGDRLADYVSIVDEQPLGDEWELVMTGSFESTARLAYATVKLNHGSSISWIDLIARRDLLFLTAE